MDMEMHNGRGKGKYEMIFHDGFLSKVRGVSALPEW
jgi:hypothetical protein